MEHTRRRSIAALQHGIDLGMTHIDTAEMYGAGAVEALVGEAIQDRRDRVFLVSKVLPANASRRGTVEACKRSLRHLKTDHLDVYLLHSPSPYPFEETLQGFQDLIAAGAIRAFGVSNFDPGQLEEAVSLAGEGAIACNQVAYHLKDRRVEQALLGRCEAHKVALVAYSPFGQGDFPEAHPVLNSVAKKHGATPRQVALAFLLRHPHVFTIPKTSCPQHAQENAEAVDLTLTDEDVARIDAAF